MTEDPQADAEERIRSAHRAIEIREKRRGGPLVASYLDYEARAQVTADAMARYGDGVLGLYQNEVVGAFGIDDWDRNADGRRAETADCC
jgi:hypothetical protein